MLNSELFGESFLEFCALLGPQVHKHLAEVWIVCSSHESFLCLICGLFGNLENTFQVFSIQEDGPFPFC